MTRRTPAHPRPKVAAKLLEMGRESLCKCRQGSQGLRVPESCPSLCWVLGRRDTQGWPLSVNMASPLAKTVNTCLQDAVFKGRPGSLGTAQSPLHFSHLSFLLQRDNEGIGKL